MATIILNDGKKLNVSYQKAAKVFAVLEGKVEPEDEKQSTFVSSVKEVIFDKPKINPGIVRNVGKREHDTEIDKINKDESLNGLQKARAIAARIKERSI